MSWERNKKKTWEGAEGMRSPRGCCAGELSWVKERLGWGGGGGREGDVGRGLEVVFAKLKGQQLEPIC